MKLGGQSGRRGVAGHFRRADERGLLKLSGWCFFMP